MSTTRNVDLPSALILTGWGWKEYAVAAALALKALGGRAEVRGMSKRHLPDFLAAEGVKWKRIYLIGLSLGGDESRLADALRAMRGKTSVMWISGLAMSASQARTIAPLLKVILVEGGAFNGALVRAVAHAFHVEASDFLPYAIEKNRIPKSVSPYHELIAAAMFAHRCYQEERPYETAIQYLATGVPETAWSEEMRRLVVHYRRFGAREIVGRSTAMSELRNEIEKIAAHPEARVLILGESGTGKETVAQQIHAKSSRRNEPFYAFSCASVTPNLLESRFFGHEKGAFTGADRTTQGLFELADGGTLFLDEIGELPLEAQGVLLRVLQDGRFMRVGGREEIGVNVRLITATNRDLPARVRDGSFRTDLFMRLNVVQIRVPPLREHKEDIRDIADTWWFGKFRRHLSDEQIAALMEYDYPGNVRELLNLLERAVVLEETDFARLVARHREINASLFSPSEAEKTRGVPEELDAAILEHVRSIFLKYARNVSHASAALKISRTTLRKYLESMKTLV
jgi:DNA-binding NtrC family response regulator